MLKRLDIKSCEFHEIVALFSLPNVDCVSFTDSSFSSGLVNEKGIHKLQFQIKMQLNDIL